MGENDLQLGGGGQDLEGPVRQGPQGEVARSADDFGALIQELDARIAQAESAKQAESQKLSQVSHEREVKKTRIGLLAKDIQQEFFHDAHPDFGDIEKIQMIAEFLFEQGFREAEQARGLIRRVLVGGNQHRPSVDRVLEFVAESTRGGVFE